MKPIPEICHVCSQLLMIDTEHLACYVGPSADYRSGWYLVCACGAGTPLSKQQAQLIHSTFEPEEKP